MDSPSCCLSRAVTRKIFASREYCGIWTNLLPMSLFILITIVIISKIFIQVLTLVTKIYTTRINDRDPDLEVRESVTTEIETVCHQLVLKTQDSSSSSHYFFTLSWDISPWILLEIMKETDTRYLHQYILLNRCVFVYQVWGQEDVTITSSFSRLSPFGYHFLCQHYHQTSSPSEGVSSSKGLPELLILKSPSRPVFSHSLIQRSVEHHKEKESGYISWMVLSSHPSASSSFPEKNDQLQQQETSLRISSQTSTRRCIISFPSTSSSSRDCLSLLTFCWSHKILQSICHRLLFRHPHHRHLQDTTGNQQLRLQREQHPSGDEKQQEGHYCDRHENTMKKRNKKIQEKNKSERDSKFLLLLLMSLPSLLINVSCSHLTITLVSAEAATVSSSSASSPSSRVTLTRSSSSSYLSGSTGEGPFLSSAGERRLSPRTVTTKYGSLRGVTMSLPNRSLQPIEAFLGVPYAASPTGKLRFMPPVTPDVWTGIRTVDRLGSVCPQTLTPSPTLLYRLRSSSYLKGSSSPPFPSATTLEDMFKNETELLKIMTPTGISMHQKMKQLLHNQSEDCLYLNIYVPVSVMNSRGTEGSRVPVLVFIAGDSFSSFAGGSLYDGSVLSSFGNIVVVTMNFRLGILGFLPALDGGASRGNFGLMDQVAALHWIQENIAEFGGDPMNVTLAGHGYGAACTNLLMVSPMVRGLFHRVIMMSGSALSPWSVSQTGVKYAREVASFLGCPSEAKKYHSMVECLRRKSVEELLSAEPISPSYLSTFGPTIDSATIRGDPLASMMSPDTSFGDYDLMLGVTKMESYDMFNAQDEKEGIDGNRRDRIFRTLIRNLFSYRLQEIFLTISNEYTDWTKTSTSSSVNSNNQHPLNLMESASEAVGDATIVAPMIRTALIHSKRSRESKSNRKTFFYNFVYTFNEGESMGSPSVSGSFSGTSTSPLSRMGSFHGQELAFVFGAPLVSPAVTTSSPPSSSSSLSSPSYLSSSTSLSSSSHLGFYDTRKYTRIEAALSEAVMMYWVNFVRSGNPSPSSTSSPTAMNSNEDSFGASASGKTGPTSSSSSSQPIPASFMSFSTASTSTDKSNVYSTKTSPDSNRLTVNKINWPLFEEHHQQYLSISLKPKVKDHYHAHKLSYWLNLIPKLNQPGPKSPGSFELHLLQDHENPASYEGIVRETRFGSPRVTSGGSGSFAYESPASSPTTGSSSLRSPSQMHFVNGSFVPVFDEESSRQQQQGSELDSSKIVSPLNPSHSGGNKARSSPSSASDLFPSESNNNNINDNDENNFRSVNSSTRTNSNTGSSGIASNFLQAALVVGVLFLLANLYIIMREFRKHQRSDRNKSKSRENERRKSRDSSPSSTNQLHLIQSHHRQHHLLLNESIDDLCTKQDVINQGTLCGSSASGIGENLSFSSGHLHHHQPSSSSSHHHHQQELEQQESLQMPSSSGLGLTSGMTNTTGLSFHPELISGHHLHLSSQLRSQLHDVYPEGIMNGLQDVTADVSQDDREGSSSPPGLQVWQRSQHQTSSLKHRGLHLHHHLPDENKTRVSMSGSSFNSNSSSSTVTSSSIGNRHTLNPHHHLHNVHQHSHHHPHASSSVHLNTSDFCTTVSSVSSTSSPLTTSGTLTRSGHHEGKKVSFVSPSESLILYDNDSKLQTDTQV